MYEVQYRASNSEVVREDGSRRGEIIATGLHTEDLWAAVVDAEAQGRDDSPGIAGRWEVIDLDTDEAVDQEDYPGIDISDVYDRLIEMGHTPDEAERLCQ